MKLLMMMVNDDLTRKRLSELGRVTGSKLRNQFQIRYNYTWSSTLHSFTQYTQPWWCRAAKLLRNNRF